MSVQEGLDQLEITLTERAAQEVNALLEEQGMQGSALRVWVAGGGCSGLSYGMAIDESPPEEGDRVLESLGVKVYVDELSLKYMTGSIVDFVDDSLGGGFKIENPKAVKACGCGSSFSVEDDTMPGLDTSMGGGCGGCGSR